MGIITLFATISVISGLSLGIKILSNIAFYLGCLILFLCFTMEKTYYLLSLIVQTAGTYMQWNIFQMPFWTDAFGALKSGGGRSVDGKSGADWWIGGWSVFYMAWWVAWACFVGTFIARISKNSSLRTIIISTFLAPTLYSLLWFGIMGGIGLRQQRQSLELQALGEEYFGDSEFYSDGSNACYDVPQEDVVVNGTVVFTNTLPGVTPVCGADGTNSWFNVMFSFSYPGSGLGGDFGGFGRFLSGFSLFALAIYFITSSDSGSLVVDILASNGAKEHNWLQRVFSAFPSISSFSSCVTQSTACAKSARSTKITHTLNFCFVRRIGQCPFTEESSTFSSSYSRSAVSTRTVRASTCTSQLGPRPLSFSRASCYPSFRSIRSIPHSIPRARRRPTIWLSHLSTPLPS